LGELSPQATEGVPARPYSTNPISIQEATMPKIKICGLTAPRILTSSTRSTDYIGFVFAESRRKVSFEQAAQ
jgi:hypothetical protein